MPNPTDLAACSTDDLRDKLAAVAEVLDSPRPDGMPRMEWPQERSDRAIRVSTTIEWILKPGALIATRVQYLRELTAARDTL
jgi:hypothetical protein